MDANGGITLEFPVDPSGITLTTGTNVLDYSSIVYGDISWVRGRTIEKFNITGILPGNYNKSIMSDPSKYKDPSYYINKIREWEDTKPFGADLRLIIGRDINSLVLINTFDVETFAGDGTMKYTLDLMEKRTFEVRSFDVTKDNEGKKEVRPTPDKAKTHTVKSGDNLYNITKSYTKDGNRYMELFERNKATLRSKNPNLIYPGESLIIPEGWLK